MKKLLYILVFAAISIASFGQDELKSDFEYRSLFSGDGVVSHGGYGSYLIGYNKINGLDAFITGGSGAWVIDHRLAIGFGGYGFNTKPKVDLNYENKEYQFTGGYGGMILEPYLFPGFPIHISIPVFLGVGGVNYHENFLNNYYDFEEDVLYDTQAFFVVEPGVDIELNVVKFFRLALWAKYRFTTDVDIFYENGTRVASKDFMQGFSSGIAFKFGRF